MRERHRSIKLCFPQESDAEEFFRILTEPKFEFVDMAPKTIEEEIKWIKSLPKNRRSGEYNFSIIQSGQLIGGAGFKRTGEHKNVYEIGYFIDSTHWGKGIATKVLKLVEEYATKKFSCVRFELYIHPKNKGSIRVAEKNGYKKEGIHKEKILGLPGNTANALVMVKVL